MLKDNLNQRFCNMEPWVKVSLLLCGFGLLKEFRPSEPYITQYFINPPLNFTETQVNQDIFPVSTYAYMISLIVVFLITDYLRYKVIIIADSLCGLIVFLMLIFCRSLFTMQVLEVFYGLFMAGEVAYYTYIYAKVDKEHFQEVTSYTRSAYLIGRALSGIVSQLVVQFNLTNYMGLQWMTVGGLIFATCWGLALPQVKKSIYFHRDDDRQPTLKSEISPRFSEGEKCSEDTTSVDTVISHSAFGYIWSDFTSAFTNIYIVKWALWWALATCGYYLVLSYIQLLWQAVRKDANNNDTQYNGAVECAYTLLGAAASITVGRLRLDWHKIGEVVLAVCSIVVGITLFVMATTNSVTVTYLLYIVFTIIYHTMITVANSEVAKHINEDSYGLIFGITTFLALIIQSCMVFVINTKLALPARDQFLVYGTYFSLLGALFLFVVLARLLYKVTCGRGHTTYSIQGS